MDITLAPAEKTKSYLEMSLCFLAFFTHCLLTGCGESAATSQSSGSSSSAAPPSTPNILLATGNLGTVLAFTEGSDGTLTSGPNPSYTLTNSGTTLGSGPIVIDASNKYAYVAGCCASGYIIFGDTITAGTGALVPNVNVAVSLPNYQTDQLLLHATPPGGGQFLYEYGASNVNSSSSISQIQAVSVDSATGNLNALSGSPFSVGNFIAYGAAVSPAGYIYLAGQDNAINGQYGVWEVLSINNGGVPQNTGAGASSPSGLFSGTPYLFSDSLGKFLFLVDSAAPNKIYTFSIGTQGVLTLVKGSPFPAGLDVNFLATTANDTYILAGSLSAAAIASLSLSSTGTLTPVAGSPFALDARPSSIGIDTSGTHVYAGTVQGTIDGLTLGSDGSLKSLSGSPFKTSTNVITNIALTH